MIRIIENGVAAEMRKTEAKSDLSQTAHEEIKIFPTLLDERWKITSQLSSKYQF